MKEQKLITGIIMILIPFLFGCKEDEPSVLSNLTYNIQIPYEDEHIILQNSSVPLPEPAEKVYFFNDTSGVMIAHNNARIYKSTDKGWTLKYEVDSMGLELRDILFTDQNTGYVVGGADGCPGNNCTIPLGRVLKTIDSGNTWNTVLSLPGGNVPSSIAVNRDNELFIVVDCGYRKSDKIFKSSDSGENWEEVSTNGFQLSKIVFTDNYGFCTGGFEPAKIYRSSDDGNTWSESKSFENTSWSWDISLIDSTGFCTVNNHTVYKTSDYGHNWIQVKEEDSYKINLLSPDTCLVWGSAGWSGGDFGYSRGSLMCTFDGGENWIDYHFKVVGVVRNSCFYSKKEGYAIVGLSLIRVIVK